MYTGNCIMLVEAKRDKEMLTDWIPEATSQAIALSEVTGCVFNFFAFGVTDYHVPSNNTVRYCLSDGTKWMFLAYTGDAQGNRISYEGPILTLVQPHLEVGEDFFKKNVQRVVESLYHWVCLAPNAKL